MSTGTILLVEDNPDDEALTLRALRKHRVTDNIVVARDGAEAIEILYEDKIRPTVVLLDINLPKLDGIEVLKRIRSEESTQFLPVVMLTSSDEESDIANSYGGGANSYIRKPTDFSEFSQTAGLLGAYWMSLNKAPPLQ